VLFFSDITNPSGNCSKFSGDLQDCDSIKPDPETELTKDGWKAVLRLPLDVLGRGKDIKKFWINLFRIDYTKNKETKYLSWMPTMTATPCFHVPAVFQEINLTN